MSSPIAKKKLDVNIQHKIVNSLHKKLSHNTRIDLLAKFLAPYFSEVATGKSAIKCIDVGCGDLGIMERLTRAVGTTSWQCLDLYDLPEELKGNPKWKNYIQFNGRDLPFEDKSLDVVFFCDVLHHANDNAEYLL